MFLNHPQSFNGPKQPDFRAGFLLSTNSASKTIPCLIACGKPAGHREVAPREFDVDSRWKPEREAEEKKKKKKKQKKKKKKGKRRQCRKTEAACVASACRNNLLTGYQIRPTSAKYL